MVKISIMKLENILQEKITPFNNWQLTKFTFDKENYYLFVEIDSGITIVTKKIDKDEFQDTLNDVTNSFEYIPPQQREAIFNTNSDSGFHLDYQPSINSPITKYVMDYVKNSSQDLNQKVDFNDKSIDAQDKAAILSIILMNLSRDHMMRTIETIAFKTNQAFPIKTKRPRTNAKYQNLSPKFIDPNHWEKYVNQDISKNSKVIAEIKKNNEKIIDQYLKNAQMDFNEFTSNPREQLKDFVNNFLLSRKLRFVNSNLGDVNFYIWMCISYGIIPDDAYFDEQREIVVAGLLTMFNDFYIFLSRVGLVTQADSNRVDKICQQQFENFIENENLDKDTDDDDEPLAEEILADINRFNEKADDEKTDAEFADILTKLMEFDKKRPILVKIKS